MTCILNREQGLMNYVIYRTCRSCIYLYCLSLSTDSDSDKSTSSVEHVQHTQSRLIDHGDRKKSSTESEYMKYCNLRNLF